MGKAMYATLGPDTDTGQAVTLSDTHRRSDLYILGKPGMAKTELLKRLILHDIEQRYGVFFLDPHGDAIDDLLKHLPGDAPPVLVLDPTDRLLYFGINLLRCGDASDIKERNDTYNRTYGVFERLWRDDFGPWLQLILSNTLSVFIENQGYTLADIPLFFEDGSLPRSPC